MSEEKLKKIGTSGGWISNDSYQIINYLYETPTRIVYNFNFKEDELQWDTEVKNYLGICCTSNFSITKIDKK